MAAAEVAIKVSVQGAQQVGSELQGIEGRLDRLTGSVKTAAHYGAGLAAAFGLVVPAISNTVRASILAADAVTTLNNSLRLSTGSVQAAGAAYEELFAIAQRSRVSFTELGATFASMNRAGQEMGVSQQRMLTVTAAVGNAMTISGGSAASLQAALVQLGQGMSSGVLRGEELNSVMEQAPRLAKALADGLGVPIGKLREMGAAGQITSEQVISALEKTAPQLAREVEGATLTVGQAFTVLSNAAIKFTGNADDATSTTAGLADAMVSLSKAITGVGESASAMGALRTIGETVKVLWSDVAFVFERTGVEIGGIAAQIAAMLRGDFSGAAAIRQEMVADAKAARQALDAYQQKTLTRPSKGDAVDTRAEDERNARRVAQLKAEQKSSEDLIKARRTLYGIKDDYETRLKGLADLYDNGNGKMPLEEYRAAVAQLAGENYKVAKSAKERATASTESYAAERAAAKEWEKTLRQASKGIEEAEGKTLGLNKAQEALVHYLESPAYQQHTEEMRQMALAKMYAWDAAIKHAEAVAAEHKIVEEWAKSRAKEGADLDARNQALREEVATIGLSKKAVAELARAKLEEAAAEQKAYAAALQSAALHAGPYKDAYEQAAKDALDNAEKLREQATLEQTKGAKQAAEEAKAEWQKAADDINRSLTDALMRGFESGKGFARNLRDTLKNMFNTLVLRPIISAVMQPVSMMVNGAVQGGMNAMGMGGGNLMGMAGNASSLYSGASSFNTGWFTNFGATAPASLYSSGAQLYSQGFETVGNGMMDLGNSMAQYSDAINTAGTWLSYGKAIYDVTQGKYGSAVGTAVGSYFGPIGAAIGGAIGGLVDKWTGSRGANHSGGVYSTTTTDRNAALSGLGLSGDPLSDFTDRGNKAIDEQLGKAVDSMGGLYNSLAKYAGGTAKQIDIVAGFAVNGQHKDEDSYGYFKLLDKLTGETLASYSKRDGGLGSDPEKAWAQYIADMGGALVGELRKADIPKWMDGIFAGLGDKITLDGLNGAMQQIAKIDGAFTQLGWHIGYLADISGDTQTALLELSGGVDGLMKNTGAYYENFYSDSERRATTERQLQKAFEGLDLKLPDIDASDARKQFRDIAEAQDLTTESGRKTWAAMMGLSEAFASVTQDAAGAATGVASFANQMSDAFGMTGDTISQILRDSVKEAQSAQEARRLAAE
ncbi:MAG: tape measure protein, partial [Proteobacteria bacterium]|nr:tape measure protein [Pseudomonadota bacterium]